MHQAVFLFCVSSKLWNLPASLGKKTNLKNKIVSACSMDMFNTTKNLIYSVYYQTSQLSVKIQNNDKIKCKNTE
jgi:hypothetical protein